MYSMIAITREQRKVKLPSKFEQIVSIQAVAFALIEEAV